MNQLWGTVPSLKAQYKNLLTNKKSAERAAKAIKKVATGTMKDVKKIKGMKSVFKGRDGNVRLYFQKEDDIVKIIAVCLKRDQDKSIRLLKENFE